jgi:hypothetical protein
MGKQERICTRHLVGDVARDMAQDAVHNAGR